LLNLGVLGLQCEFIAIDEFSEFFDFFTELFNFISDLFRGWCVTPNPNDDGVQAGVSVNVWNAKRRFWERQFCAARFSFHLINADLHSHEKLQSQTL
jgi:hypothetical protein